VAERLQQEEAQMSQTVSDILVRTLEQIGVKHIFGLIGDSLNPFADAVRRSDIKWIGVRHAAESSTQARYRPRAKTSPAAPLGKRAIAP
jgi:thiamine pyrophosphate-dependent acetolactate synthase large subunit-like protein